MTAVTVHVPGVPAPQGSMRSPLSRLMAKVAKTDECWQFMGAKGPKGYGRIYDGGRAVYAHRLSYELHVGPIPDGAQIDHLCRNTSCVRPDHLEPVTPRENVLRGTGFAAVNAAKTHCDEGHDLDRVDGRGYRYCGICRRARKRAAYAARRAA